jgi:hypothetical protein
VNNRPEPASPCGYLLKSLRATWVARGDRSIAVADARM